MTSHTFVLILEGLGVLGAEILVFIAGHKQGRHSCRHDYADGFDKGHEGANAEWEAATGTTLDQFATWHRPPEPDLDGGWQEPPATEVLLAEADTLLGKPRAPRVPSVAEVDQMVTEYEAARWTRGPVLASVTDARPSGFVKAEGDVRPELLDAIHRALLPDETPTITGVLHAPGTPLPQPDRPEWLDCAAMDAEAAAFMRLKEAEMASFRRGIGIGATR